MGHKRKETKTSKAPQHPMVGQMIYVGPGPECTGGQALITETEIRFKGKKKSLFVKLNAHPRGFLNWTNGLRPKQKALEKKYGDTKAKYDPDDRSWGMPE